MLVTMKEILTKANEENYAVAAPNVCTELDTRACIEAAEELQAPLIIDLSLIEIFEPPRLRRMSYAAFYLKKQQNKQSTHTTDVESNAYPYILH